MFSVIYLLEWRNGVKGNSSLSSDAGDWETPAAGPLSFKAHQD